MMDNEIMAIQTGNIKNNSRDPVIEISGLCISFGNLEVLKNISLDLFKGENLVILGRSGCGKSVLIKCIVGLLSPDAGSITVMGKELTGISEADLYEQRKKIGFLFQRDALYDSMTVRENLAFPLTRLRKGLSSKQIDERIKSALENVGLSDAIDKMPSELSGGMRKRVSLARTLVIEPVIMLYDEPTTGLDPATTDEISILINEVRSKYKTSSIIITHDIRCAKTVTDRAIVLNQGTILMEGRLEELEMSPDPFVRSFFN